MAAPKKVRPPRVQVTVAGPAGVAGRYQVPRFQRLNVPLAFGKIDGFGVEQLRQTIWNPRNAVQVPGDSAPPVGFALFEGFPAVRLHVSDNFEQKLSVPTYVRVTGRFAPRSRRAGGF